MCKLLYGQTNSFPASGDVGKMAWNDPGPGSTDWYRRMFIHPNGNIGIGTIIPTEKLSVNRKIRTHEIKVEAANSPDYVFVKSHLPDIPSAEDVKVNRVDLGDMNAKLLKKIEELTLYMIELNKIIKSQQNEINQIKSKIN
ncbi:hypothetical protein [Pedobacter panaciterrae]